MTDLAKLDLNQIEKVWHVGKDLYCRYDGKIYLLNSYNCIEDCKFYEKYLRNNKDETNDR